MSRHLHRLANRTALTPKVRFSPKFCNFWKCSK